MFWIVTLKSLTDGHRHFEGMSLRVEVTRVRTHTGCVEGGHLDPWEGGVGGTLAKRNGEQEMLE